MTEKGFETTMEKGFDNGKMKEKNTENRYLQGTFEMDQ